MADELETRSEAGVMTLLGGVISDVHRLIAQQLALFRHEVQGDFDRVRAGGTLLAAGLLILGVGGVTLCGMLTLLMARIVPTLPMWACCGAVGVPVSVLGASLSWAGMQRLGRINTTDVAPTQSHEENTHG